MGIMKCSCGCDLYVCSTFSHYCCRCCAFFMYDVLPHGSACLKCKDENYQDAYDEMISSRQLELFADFE